MLSLPSEMTISYDLYTFGHDNYGQLGLGDYKDRNIPTLVNLDFKVKMVSCGDKHTSILV